MILDATPGCVTENVPLSVPPPLVVKPYTPVFDPPRLARKYTVPSLASDVQPPLTISLKSLLEMFADV